MESIDASAATTDAASGRTGLRIALAAAFCLIGAGALLWWREGDAVFAGLLTALSLCF
ncbi:hypothetical protein [Enterovirga rhinocerotis]|uniref:Uncharacterized protein n=1 Tax=Enterovirga rhinocerotis TaxID=1339210 RepID=A0A4R7BN99_9HYPH|nr:hypothetical protein [Enterovirga rhinocerotis]TDR85406.1 hypothetical protein EV668_4527 [Enterovirga rhinocerotis]